MSKTALRVAVLIVSTTAAKDPSTDSSQAALSEVLAKEDGRWEVVETKIVPDVASQIQEQIMLWADRAADHINLILTSGGTGFTVADNTPEAVSALIHKPAPGLVHAMLAASLDVTPFAMMARPVAGVRNKSIVITLPGSPKGARENLQAVLKTLPHACLQAASIDSRALHAGGIEKLEAEAGLRSDSGQARAHGQHHNHGAGHQHSHSHGSSHDGHRHGHGHSHDHGHGNLVRHTPSSANPMSNDPNLGPSRRSRESPYPMLSVDDALKLIKQHTPPPEIITSKVDVSLPGLVLAEDVRAKENVPAFRASIVDGYAVVVPKGGDMKGVFPVVSVSHASPGEAKPLKVGEISRITTGAPLPPGATSVIMVEDTILKTMTDDGKEEREVEILADNVKEGENIREMGSDIKAGATILSKGERISAVGGEIGLLAAVGVAEVKTYRRPILGVLSTGDEIVPHDRPGTLRLGEVRDTNRITLMCAARECGYEAIDLGIAADRPGTLEETLRHALRRVDFIVTTGGVSMGELDLLKPTIERALGGTIHFGRVAMKPGKPTTFATVPVKEHSSGHRTPKVVFSLPGNPASAIVTFHLFVLPSLHRAAGIAPEGLPRARVTLAHDFTLDRTRPEYHRAVVSAGPAGLVAVSTGGQRSSKVSSLRGANCLLCMPSGDKPLRKGTTVDALLMGPIRSDLW
ncbi:gephyrin [Durotheca rogersii]|uniref:gephyrin n=1 Tax=Durotheca rogersii TaxID=419775 RepID=UPI00221F30EE|nr:gephyrin [Durotheca rogersii]KAI5868400.1 gephyrin [Durotheca rogersii]